MKLPQKPPAWINSLKSSPKEITAILQSEEALKFIRQANMQYWHWDELRRHPLPKPWSAEQLWAAVKLTRSGQQRTFGLRDTRDEPFSYWLPEAAQADLHEIDMHLGGHIGFDLPEVARDRRQYLVNSLMEEAIASSQIEGAATTRKIAKEMLRTGRRPRTRGEQMIFNNYQTIQMLAELKQRPLSVEMLLQIQESMTRGTLDDPTAAGRLRNLTDDIHVVDARDNTVLHTPPPADQLARRLAALCEFANRQETDGFLHPVVRAILLHFWLAYDHPFVDGNGRAARALFYWHMLRGGYWLFEFLPISRIIVEAPIRYARAYLYSESDDCDATYFIMFHLRAIRRALKDLKEYLQSQQQKLREAREWIKHSRDLNHRQLALLYEAATDPGREFTIEGHEKTYVVSYGTAYADLQELVRRGLLARARRGRQFVFYPAENPEARPRRRS